MKENIHAHRAGGFFKKIDDVLIRLREPFLLENENSNNIKLISYMVIAYVFSLVARYYWVYVTGQNPTSIFAGEVMINTNDGYYWAENARDMLAGKSVTPLPLSVITVFFAKVLPFSFEAIILWMGAFLSSLIVVPMILIGRMFKQTDLGFIAALLSSIAHSYYNRTMAGYYDTDILIIVFPLFVIYFVMLVLKDESTSLDLKNIIYLTLMSAFIVGYRWYYPGSYSLLIATSIAILLYATIISRRSKDFLIVFFLLGNAYLDSFILQIGFDIVFLSIFYFFKQNTTKILVPSIIILVGVLIYMGVFDPIISQLKGYVFRSVTQGDDGGLHFYSVVQTVREAGGIDPTYFMNRISGHTATFILSLLCLIPLMLAYPIFFVLTPMLALGFLGLTSGLRFTIFAIPLMAFGVSYLIVYLSKLAQKTIQNKLAYAISFVVMGIGVLAPNISHIHAYMPQTVFNLYEVKVLDSLKSAAKEDDYVLSWWDYGYPIRYYSHTKTLIDGGKHSGAVNFIPSLVLSTQEPSVAAKLSRLDVEYTKKQIEKHTAKPNIAVMAKDYGFDSEMDFLSSLKDIDISKTPKTSDVYLYLNFRMLYIFSTIEKFSNLNIESGQFYSDAFYRYTNAVSQKNGVIYFANGLIFSQTRNFIQAPNGQFKVKSFIEVSHDGLGRVRTNVLSRDLGGILNVIFLKNYGAFLIVDDKAFNSTFVQMFIFENYNEDLFEPVMKNATSKVYRLKI